MSGDATARFIGSAAGSVFAELSTLPTDVAKVRLQLDSSAAGGVPKYAGFADCILQTAKQEGPLALWKGLAPALIRQVCYTSMSLVIYEPIRDFYMGVLGGGGPDGKPNYIQRLFAGGTAGAISISIFNPAEVVKTQVQSSRESLTMRAVCSKVLAKDGVKGFWAGVGPNVARTFLVNAAELGTYDEAKTRLIPTVGDGLLAHVGASGAAGFTSACVSTPADVVKTRLMNSAGGEKQYSGMFNAGQRILVDEGPAALYKGFLPICIRKLIWCTVFFVSYEQIRKGVNDRS